MYEDFQDYDHVIDILTGKQYTWWGVASNNIIVVGDDEKKEDIKFTYSDYGIRQFYKVDEHPKITVELENMTVRLRKRYYIFNRNTKIFSTDSYNTWTEALGKMPTDINCVVMPIEYHEDIKEVNTITEQR